MTLIPFYKNCRLIKSKCGFSNNVLQKDLLQFLSFFNIFFFIPNYKCRNINSFYLDWQHTGWGTIKPVQSLKSKGTYFVRTCGLQIKSCWVLLLSDCWASLRFSPCPFQNAHRVDMAMVSYCFFHNFPCTLISVGNGSRSEGLPKKSQGDTGFWRPQTCFPP